MRYEAPTRSGVRRMRHMMSSTGDGNDAARVFQRLFLMSRLSEQPRAILVDVIPPQIDKPTAERRLAELEQLTRTYGGMIIVRLMQRRATPDYRTYIGSGKISEIIALAKQEHAELLIINNLLKPKQLFEIEELIRKARASLVVWERVDLILNIFAKHATTAESKLQIKLAALRHMGPRIFGMGHELMQQAGGIGSRGAGETNTEMMRRHLADQERHVKKMLDRVAVAHAGHRRHRVRQGFKTVSIVGYTNAGKSSLLRALTQKQTLVEDALFATLDTRVGKLWTPGGERVLLSDTIGFIQDLPPRLIDAFRSTLEETINAHLLLHVIDVSDPCFEQKIMEVDSVLDELGIRDAPQLYAFNKTDAAKQLARRSLLKKYRVNTPVFVSCTTGEGLPQLSRTILRRLSKPAATVYTHGDDKSI